MTPSNGFENHVFPLDTDLEYAEWHAMEAEFEVNMTRVVTQPGTEPMSDWNDVTVELWFVATRRNHVYKARLFAKSRAALLSMMRREVEERPRVTVEQADGYSWSDVTAELQVQR
jgi:hypothetical protein